MCIFAIAISFSNQLSFHESSSSKKMIAVIHFFIYHFNIIAPCIPSPLIGFFLPVCLPSPPQMKQYTVTLWVYTNLIPHRGSWGRSWT